MPSISFSYETIHVVTRMDNFVCATKICGDRIVFSADGIKSWGEVSLSQKEDLLSCRGYLASIICLGATLTYNNIPLQINEIEPIDDVKYPGLILSLKQPLEQLEAGRIELTLCSEKIKTSTISGTYFPGRLSLKAISLPLNVGK